MGKSIPMLLEQFLIAGFPGFLAAGNWLLREMFGTEVGMEVEGRVRK